MTHRGRAWSAAWVWRVIAVLVIGVVVARLPGRSGIPPRVESDYAYLLTAADRLYQGFGPTAPIPVAPLQPWEWRADWAFLTQWPVGYPALVCAVRWVTGGSTLEACGWINVAAVAAALVGWFVMIRRCVPRGLSGVALAAVGAACAVSPAWLINPTTDLILTAELPWVMLAAMAAVGRCEASEKGGLREGRPPRALWRFALPGLLAGGLFWIRYASVFVPGGIGLWLLVMAWRRRAVRAGEVLAFVAGAGVPIVTLVAINATFGAGDSVQAQLNLGASTELNLSPGLLAEAWWRFTDVGFYAHWAGTHALYALGPVVVVAGTGVVWGLGRARGRRGVGGDGDSLGAGDGLRDGDGIVTTEARRRFFLDRDDGRGFALAACMLIACLGMIVGATAVFGSKYDYVGLERYYIPVRPLYVLLFVGPVLHLPWQTVRGVCTVGLVVVGLWIVQVDWVRPYVRWAGADRPAAPSGAWAQGFGDGADELYEWLCERRRDELVVVSNFHEYVTLETGIPALPVPPDGPTLDRWLGWIRAARGVDDVEVLFALDPDNGARDYWIPDPAKVLHRFSVEPVAHSFGRSVIVGRYRPDGIDGGSSTRAAGNSD